MEKDNRKNNGHSSSGRGSSSKTGKQAEKKQGAGKGSKPGNSKK